VNVSWQSEFIQLFEKIFGASAGSTPFLTIAGIALGTLVLFGWLIVNFVCSTRKGILVTFFSLAIPGILGAFGWIAAMRFGVPQLDAGPLRDQLPILVALSVVLITSFFITRKLLGTSEKACLVALVCTYACVFAAIQLGGSLVHEMDTSLSSLEEKKMQRDKYLMEE